METKDKIRGNMLGIHATLTIVAMISLVLGLIIHTPWLIALAGVAGLLSSILLLSFRRSSHVIFLVTEIIFYALSIIFIRPILINAGYSTVIALLGSFAAAHIAGMIIRAFFPKRTLG
ncbi:MAG: hypothetical protein AB9897_06145 [Anaerolineaceae bacterium]